MSSIPQKPDDDIEQDTVAQRAAFIVEALAARDEMLRSGIGFDAADVPAYLRARLQGREATRPTPKAWRVEPGQ